MAKITVLAFSGKDKKGGLLKDCIDKAVKENKQVTKGLGGGLLLVVTKNTGRAVFYCRKPYKKIGLASKMSLATAFEQVNKLQTALKKELKSEEATKSSAPLLKEFFPSWVSEKKEQLKEGSNRSQNLMSLFRHTLLPLHNYKLDELTPKLVYDRISLINQTDGNKYNAVGVLIQCLRNACLKGYIKVNPISDMLKGGESPFKKPKTKGFKSVLASQLKDKYFQPLSSCPVTNRVFYLLISLVGFRFSECRLLQWDWIDFESKMIIIPKDAIGANKTQTEYRKPMSEQTYLLLLNWNKFCQINNKRKFVFQSDYGMGAICEASIREPFKCMTSKDHDFHGLRKTLKTWLVSENCDNVVSELAISHDCREVTERTYDKYDYTEKIRDALQKWATYLESQLTPEFKELLNKNFFLKT